MLTKKQIKVLSVVILVVLGICWIVGRVFFFYTTGSRSGKVVDATTGKPIRDAVVYYEWDLRGGLIESTTILGASHETKTDKDGEYYIPSHWIRKHLLFSLEEPEEVFVYKEGYVWYREIFGEVQHFMIYMPNVKLKYCKNGNLVKLQPWINELSHEEHMGIFTRGFGFEGMMLKEALKNEMAIAKRESQSKEAQERMSNKVCYELMGAKPKYEKNEINKEKYITLLHKGLQSRNPQTLKLTSVSLEELGDKSYIPVLMEFLKENLYREDFTEIFFQLRTMMGKKDLSFDDRTLISWDINERKKGFAELEALCEEYKTKCAAEWYGNIAVASKNNDVRFNAIDILGKSTDKEATLYLLKCINDPDVDYKAIVTLGNKGDASAIPALKNKLIRYRGMPIRHGGIAVLGKEGDTSVGTGLRNRFAHDVLIRQAAVIALHRLGDDSGASIMIEALKSHDLEEQSRAVIALSEIANQDFCEGKPFDQFSPDEQQKIIQKCLMWWEANRDKSSTK